MQLKSQHPALSGRAYETIEANERPGVQQLLHVPDMYPPDAFAALVAGSLAGADQRAALTATAHSRPRARTRITSRTWDPVPSDLEQSLATLVPMDLIQAETPGARFGYVDIDQVVVHQPFVDLSHILVRPVPTFGELVSIFGPAAMGLHQQVRSNAAHRFAEYLDPGSTVVLRKIREVTRVDIRSCSTTFPDMRFDAANEPHVPDDTKAA